jgi:UDP-N-acetylmuramyl tripeptide synthase
MILNDKYADGRDMSWLWDTNFELLKDYENEIVLSGIRAYDMAVRLKYAGFDTKKIIIKNKIKDAMKYALCSIKKEEHLLVMPTYTALLEMQKIWK